MSFIIYYYLIQTIKKQIRKNNIKCNLKKKIK